MTEPNRKDSPERENRRAARARAKKVRNARSQRLIALFLSVGTAAIVALGLWTVQATLLDTFKEMELESANLAIARVDARLELAAEYGADLSASRAVSRELEHAVATLEPSLGKGNVRLLLSSPSGKVMAVAPTDTDNILRQILATEASSSELAKTSYGEHITLASIGAFKVVSRPIRARGALVGYLVAALPSSQVPPAISMLADEAKLKSIATILAGFLVSYIALMFFGFDPGARVRRRSVALVCGMTALLSLSVYSLMAASSWEEELYAKRNETTQMLLDLVQNDTVRTLGRDFELERIRFDRFGWETLVAQLGHVDKVEVWSPDDVLIYRTGIDETHNGAGTDGDEEVVTQESDDDCCVSIIRPLATQTSDGIGQIAYHLDSVHAATRGLDRLRQAAKLEALHTFLANELGSGVSSWQELGFKLEDWVLSAGNYDFVERIAIRTPSGATRISFTHRFEHDLFEISQGAESTSRDLKDFSGTVGRLEVVEKQQVGGLPATNLVLDLSCVVLVMALIIFEVLLLVSVLLHGWSNKRNGDKAQQAQPSDFMRPITFLLLIGIDLPMSFVPLYADRIYEPLLGLPHHLVLALPISAEFLCVGIAMLGCGTWIDRFGWRPVLILGAALASLGALLSWFAADLVFFILARAVLGAGFGLALLSSQSYVVSRSSSSKHAPNLAQLFAGIYGGSIAGGVGGALLAEYVGFGLVFAIGAMVCFLSLNLIVMLTSAKESAPRAPNATIQWSAMAVFLSDGRILALVVLASLPLSLAAVGFLNYFGPVYLSAGGASQSIIGQVLILYGLAMVLLGPSANKLVTNFTRKRAAVIAGGILGALSFSVFWVFDGVIAMVLAILLMGIGHSLSLSSQSALLLSLPAAKKLGETTALGLFRATARFGQVLGPVVFGTVLLQADVASTIAMIGVVYALAAIAFWGLFRPLKAVPQSPTKLSSEPASPAPSRAARTKPLRPKAA